MSEKIQFTKMHGAGNDFIMIDNRNHHFSGDEHDIFRHMCERHFGIGADGLMLLDFDDPADLFLKYYNSNGKPAENVR